MHKNARRGARAGAVQGAEPCRTPPVRGGEGGSRATLLPPPAASSCRSPLLIALPSDRGSTNHLHGNLTLAWLPFTISPNLAIDACWPPVNPKQKTAFNPDG